MHTYEEIDMPLQRIARAGKTYWKESLGTTLVLVVLTIINDPSAIKTLLRP